MIVFNLIKIEYWVSWKKYNLRSLRIHSSQREYIYYTFLFGHNSLVLCLPVYLSWGSSVFPSFYTTFSLNCIFPAFPHALLSVERPSNNPMKRGTRLKSTTMWSCNTIVKLRLRVTKWANMDVVREKFCATNAFTYHNNLLLFYLLCRTLVLLWV